MGASASASSSEVPCEKYDVFISFRGSDIRSGFLSHLEKELRRKTIDVYVDDGLERGEEIWSSLVNAIKGSMIALVIFSKDYASSEWCLKELAKIMELKEANLQIVMPVFYEVAPSDVRDQKHTYADAFTHLEHKFNDDMDKLEIWRSVLKKAANLSGYHSSNFGNESELIDAIVEDVLKKLEENNPIVPKYQLTGFHQNFISVESLMEIQSQDVRALGIWGMGGIGKSTLARAIFNKFLSKFESHCFLEHVREKSTKIDGLSSLRQKLLFELLGRKDHINMDDAKRRLQWKKVLIVLDDVDNPKQLKDLAGQHLLLGLGSRIIVTSRDKHVLESGGIHDKYIHEVKELTFKESLELFSIHAFNQSHPNMGYQELTKRTVAIAKGIPLALEVLGSHFHSRDKVYWESELSKLQKYPHQQIQNIFKVSFDGLDPMDKEIFLDIAFFFVRERKDKITYVLEACGFKATSGIQNLIDKALIKSNSFGSIVMHDLIQEMAEQIVREECMRHPERRSRLKDADEICDILKSDLEGTHHEIEGIILDVSQSKNVQLRADIFTRMKNLRILKVFNSTSRPDNVTQIKLPTCLDYFPDKLRYFHWHGYPSESLPFGFCAENLVALCMRYSKVKKLWDGKQDLANLKTIDLSWSEQLMELPNLSMANKLEIVDLSSCSSLSSVHPSILSLHSIVEIDVSGCWELKSLESETHLESLSHFNAACCVSLKKFSLSSKRLSIIDCFDAKVEILHLPIGSFTVLRELDLNVERLMSLPINELCCLTNLEKLEIRDFKQVIDTMELQSLFDAWRNLTYLCLIGWSYLSEIPDNIKGLKRLRLLALNDSAVETLPACINHLSSLKCICLRRCKMLKSILGLPPFLQVLDAAECTLLETISFNSLLWNRCEFYLWNCVKLDECSLRLIQELITHFSMTLAYQFYRAEACYPGSRVPKWMKYKQMTKASNAIEFTCNLERSLAIGFCCVVPHHLISNRLLDAVYCVFSYDNNKFWSTFYDTYPSDVIDDYDVHELNSDHVLQWRIERAQYGAATSNRAKISCKFFMNYRNDVNKGVSKVLVKACGVHVIYKSKLGRKRKRKSDIGVEEQLPLTK